MKNVVVIGGGHGQATICRGIKDIDGINLYAIVTVADDGGSTGRLRELYNIPAVGDIRNVLVAMSEREDLFNQLLDYRFKGDENTDVVGHSFGNLMLTALMDIKNGSLIEAIKEVGKMINAKGRVLPASEDVLTLYAKFEDGTIEKGEANIPLVKKVIETVFYDKEVKAEKEAIKAIENADLIIFGIGSLYTSILPIAIIDEIKKALSNSKAKKVYFANSMTQAGETYGYDLKDHVDALKKHGVDIDVVVKHNDTIPDDIKERYKKEKAVEVIDHNNVDVEVIKRELLDFSKNNVRHNPAKIKKVVEELLEK